MLSNIDYVINLIRSTRIQRTCTGMIAVLVPAAFANSINSDIFLFCFCSVLLYAGAGIQNAKKDNDYDLPAYSGIVSLLFFIATFVLALKSFFVLIGIIVELILGVYYNMYSRYVFLGDVTVLTITHHTWPTFISSMILGLNLFMTLKLTFFMFFTFWFIIHLKNLKDTIDDKKRGYKTLTTELESGKKITLILYMFSFICMFFGYFVLNLGVKYLLSLLVVFFLKILIVELITRSNNVLALNLMRLEVIIFLSGMIIEKATSLMILNFSASVSVFYVLFIIKDIVPNVFVLKKKPISVPDPH